MKEAFLSHLSTLIDHPHKQRFLLAVSGGKDSTVMVHLFADFGLPFDMAHCNFHLRGENSNEDMRFVQNLALHFGVKLHIKEFDTQSLQKDSGLSIEMTARELRYRWFDSLADDYDYVVTAHHADDNAETVLLNLVRGTGLRGLTGIPVKNGKYLRPFLPFTSEDILTYAKTHQIAFRTDESNQSEQFHRNKIRLSVFPKMKEINPNVISTFTHNIKIFNQLDTFLERQICNILAEITQQDDDKLLVSISKLKELPDKELLLFECLRPYHFDAATTHAVVLSLEAETGRTFNSPTHQLLKDRDYLIVKKKEEYAKIWHLCHSIQDLESCGFSVQKVACREGFQLKADAQTLYVDADKLQFPVLIRGWEKGDWFVPFGMNGRKKVSDLFTDLKIDRFSKMKVPILCSNDNIVWVVGLRADTRYRVDEHSEYYYKINYHGKLRI